MDNMHRDTHEPVLRGHTVVDEHGDKVGTVADVIFDDSGQPTWVVVDLGVLHASHYVPMADAYESSDERLVIPFPKDIVKHSPKAGRDHVLTRDQEAELLEYYGLAA